MAKAKDDAKKRTRPKQTAPPPLGHAAKVPRVCRSVETHLRLMNEDDLLAQCDSPDLPDSPPPSPAVTVLRRPRTDEETREMAIPLQARAVSLPYEYRPENRAPAEYLARLLHDRPTTSLEQLVKKVTLMHSWPANVTRYATLCLEAMERSRKLVFNDIRALFPSTLDELSALPLAVRLQQLLELHCGRPK